MSINDLQPGQKARIQQFSGLPPQYRQKLLDLGLIRGELVELVYRAPLGDPLCIEIKHYQLSLRSSVAAQIIIEPVDQAEIVGG